ncbi:MAG: alkaline phosphatase D family protein [Verrucomicrobiales bacterium]|nr:alkaline phosphatase D family protein [Verrucomicrobiales bacterium]
MTPIHKTLFQISLLSIFFFSACNFTPKYEISTFAGQGILVGEVTANSALVQLRLTSSEQLMNQDLLGAAGFVEFILQGEQKQTLTAAASPEHDFIARVAFKNLKPGTLYQCKTRIGMDKSQLSDGPTATFKTLPGAESDQAVRFVVVTGMNYAKFHGDQRIDQAEHLLENNTKLPAPYAGDDKELGYPALAAILKAQPDFFVATGDNVYYDTPNNPAAHSITELRQKWHEQFVQARFKDLFAAVPTYWMVDDHDYRTDDCDNSGDYEPSPALGKRIMLEQLPYAKMDDADALTYRTHRISRDLQIWLPEGRIHRSPNAMPDGPEKTIWGAKQKAWIKKTLSKSDAKYKLFISPTPMLGPDDLRKKDNHTNFGGFRNERDDFFAFLKDSGIDKKGFFIICGDRHWQYHSVDSSGLEEFSCGALIDANSRLGRKPGDPKSTDAKGLIKQPYYQTPRSGGYLMVEVKPTGKTNAKLKVTWHDEHGEILHTTEKN